MIDTQLMKGILEGCVLSVIAEHETYGYEILQRLTESGFTELGEGTMYPVLTRLEKNGYIQCRKEKSPLGTDPEILFGDRCGGEAFEGILREL